MIDLRLYANEITELTRYEEGIKHKYTVDEVYPFFLRCHSNSGSTMCFNIGDLVEMGVLRGNNRRNTLNEREKRRWN